MQLYLADHFTIIFLANWYLFFQHWIKPCFLQLFISKLTFQILAHINLKRIALALHYEGRQPSRDQLSMWKWKCTNYKINYPFSNPNYFQYFWYMKTHNVTNNFFFSSFWYLKKIQPAYPISTRSDNFLQI